MTPRCRHIQAIMDELRSAGATAVEVTRDGAQLRVSWTLNGRATSIALSAHPRDEVAARNRGRQAMRRACRGSLVAGAAL